MYMFVDKFLEKEMVKIIFWVKQWGYFMFDSYQKIVFEGD